MNAHRERYREPAEPPDGHFLAATKGQPDAVVVLDRLGRIRYVSSASRRLAGYGPNEMIGTHVRRWVHRDDLPQLFALLSRWGNGDMHEPLIGRICHADGRWHWLEAEPLQASGPQFSDQFVFFVREITGHRRLERQYRMAESIAVFGVWRVELDRPVPELSQGMMELFGYGAGERVSSNRKFWPLWMVHRPDVRHVLKTFRGAIHTPGAFSFCCRIHPRDGSMKILKTQGYVETDIAGAAVAVTGISQDITLIELVHKELKASEEKYRLLTDRISDIICQLSLDGTIEFISPAVQRILGRSADNLRGKDFRIIVAKEDLGQFARFLRQAASGKKEAVCTLRARCADDKSVWLELSGRRLKNGNGNHSVVCAARDVTKRKQVEIELVHARLQAEEANASKSRFLTNVSHDLRTPLNAILGFAELIREQIFGPVCDPRYAEYAALIHESGTLLRSFLSDLLDLSKIEAGKYELHSERFQLKDVAPSCVHQILPLARGKRLKIEDRMSESDLQLFADKRGVAQILINLLSNATKFTPKEGKIELSAKAEDGMAALTVRDTGIGIKPEDIDRITSPFEGTVRDYGYAQEGTGLGLAIVKSLAELHGGNLRIESAPGRGTRATVRLPREQVRRAT